VHGVWLLDGSHPALCVLRVLLYGLEVSKVHLDLARLRRGEHVPVDVLALLGVDEGDVVHWFLHCQERLELQHLVCGLFTHDQDVAHRGTHVDVSFLLVVTVPSTKSCDPLILALEVEERFIS